ncbi:MAG: transglutaminase family protein, partial [Azonexus sp.]
MVRIQFAIDLHYELGFQGADFVFNIHAAKTASQTIVSEQLVVSQQVPHTIQTDPSTCTRYLRLTGAPGPLHISYKATLDIKHQVDLPDLIQETPIARLPLSALTY